MQLLANPTQLELVVENRIFRAIHMLEATMKKLYPTKMKALIVLISLLWLPVEINAQDGNYVETNGVKIYYETHGEGEPLLMLHGFSLSHKGWDPWIEDLSKSHQLIIPDLRGHGHSSNPSRIFTHKLSAMDIYGLMDYLNIDRFNAIGHSSGAMTLTHMATMDTSRISSMILVAGTSFYSDQARSKNKATADGPMPWMEGHHPGGEEQTKMLKTQFRNLAENFTPPDPATITCPTLIIHGDRDPVFSVDSPIIFYEAIPNSYLWIVPNDVHSPIGIYKRDSIWSDVFLKVMDEFFGGKWE